jgi:hypothetical protein
MAFPTSPVDGQIYKNKEWSTLLNAWVILKQVGFRANQPAVTVPNNTIIFGTIQHDTHNGFNVVTGLYTVPTNGLMWVR